MLLLRILSTAIRVTVRRIDFAEAKSAVSCIIWIPLTALGLALSILKDSFAYVISIRQFRTEFYWRAIYLLQTSIDCTLLSYLVRASTWRATYLRHKPKCPSGSSLSTFIVAVVSGTRSHVEQVHA